MSFFTSLTGLNAATAQLGVTSNNIANASTIGFKRSRADFGDIFATSPLQKATSTFGQGVALKQVTQEFGQGNLNFSSNTLDLAISGDGFFPLKSVDGFQDIFTRNGAFMMNDQNNVVNSAGQKLMAASVDSTGKANLSDLNVLTIPQQTTGMAKETSLVQLGLNFPADAQVMTKAFNRNDPSTYNKSTALTVYDKGGNGYLATVYYAKTQNASQADPNNKWQTYVYVGDTLVAASLQQATDSTGQPMYVNKYGDLKPESEVADLLTNVKTEKFSLNDLKDVRTSSAASVNGGVAPGLSSLGGIDFTTLKPSDLQNLFSIDIDGSGKPVSIGLDHLAGLKNATGGDLVLNGVQIAKELTNVINRKFGDERAFNFKSQQSFEVTSTTADGTLKQVRTVQLDDNNMTYEQVVNKINSQLNGSSTVLSNVNFAMNPPDPSEFRGYSIQIGNQTLSGKVMLPDNLSSNTAMDQLAAAVQTQIQADAQNVLGFTPDQSSQITVNLQNGNEIRVTDSGGASLSNFKLTSLSVGTPNSFVNTKQLKINAANVTNNPSYYSTMAVTVGGTTYSLDLTGTDPVNNLSDYATKVQAALQSELTAGGWSAHDASTVTVTPDAANGLITISDSSGHGLTDVSQSKGTPFATNEVINGVSSVNLNDVSFAKSPASDKTANPLNLFSSLNVSVIPSGGTNPVTVSVDMTNAANFPSLTALLTTAGTTTGANVLTQFDPTNQTQVAAFNQDMQSALNTAISASGSVPPLTLTYKSNANNNNFGSFSLSENTATGAVFTQMSLVPNDQTPAAGSTNPNYSKLIDKGSATATGKNLDDKGNTLSSYYTISNVSFPQDRSPKGDEFDSFAYSVGGGALKTISFGGAIAPLSNQPINDLAATLQAKIRTDLTNSSSLSPSEINNITVTVINGKDLKLTDPGGNDLQLKLNINPSYLDVSGGTSGISGGGSTINLSPLATSNLVKASYDPVTQQFSFAPPSGSGNQITLSVGQADGGVNDQLGITSTTPLTQPTGVEAITTNGKPYADPNHSNFFRDPSLQRYGMQVQYDGVNQDFVFSSGSTGDQSSISVVNDQNNTFAAAHLGLAEGAANAITVKPSTVDAVRGKQSLPAVMKGSSMGINPNNNFSVNLTNNTFVVSVDDVKGTVTIDPKDSYTIDSFTNALQNAINNLTGPSDQKGLTGSSVSGVKVGYDPATNSLTFTSGTTGSNSFIKVSGDSQWGLANVSGARGSTTSWIKPTQYSQTVNGVQVPQYIDQFGKETFSPDGFTTLPEWSPIYLEKGELTFDTSGNLVSPKQGSQLDTVFLPDGKGSLRINIDYSKSTQFSSPYAVLSQSQDGAPEGDLVGLAIGDDGLVNASYSNGSQKSLGKVVLVNFSNPAGLRQIGDTSYYKSSNSGTPKYGEAGSAGFGTVKSGATERANVDITQELVDLITEQRNFQANAKAIETSTTLTQSIIQIRA